MPKSTLAGLTGDIANGSSNSSEFGTTCPILCSKQRFTRGQLRGWCNGDQAAVFVPYGYVVQVETAPEVLGRVFATAGGIQNAFLVMVPPLGAVLGELWGIGFVFTAAGIAFALLGLVVFFLRPTVATKAATENAALQTSAA